MYIYIYIYTYTYIYIYIYIYTQMYMNTYYLYHTYVYLHPSALRPVANRVESWILFQTLGLRTLACVHFLNKRWTYDGLTHNSMYSDMGFETLRSFSFCELKV